jgi:hypothetical protein
MSSHSSFRDWKIVDDLPEGLTGEISECVNMNRKVQPGCFAIFCHADNIIYFMWNLLDEKEITRDKVVEAIEKEAESAPHPENFKNICLWALNNAVWE